MGKYLVTPLFFFFFHLNSYSQIDSGTIWRYIDTNIAKKKNLSDLNSLLQQLKQKTIADKNYFQAGRCYFYQLLISDQRTEDSLYFHNSAFIDSLLMTPSTPPELQMVMHLVIAKRISSFTAGYLRFNRQRYERRDIPFNYAAYSNDQLDSIAHHHFDQGKILAKKLSFESIDDVLWLSSNPLLFLFRPDLFDLVIADQITYTKEGSLPYKLQLKQRQWLPLSPDEFIGKIDSVCAVEGKEFQTLGFYDEWLTYHKKDTAIYYFVETLARKYFAGNALNDYDGNGKLYERYLQSLSSSPYTTVKAHSVYQLCLFWNSESKKYFPGNGEDNQPGSYHENPGFDASKQYKAADALNLFDQNKNMLDSFAYLKNILLEMERKILTSSLQIKMDQYNLPGEPLLAELIFKNTSSLHYRIVSVPQNFSVYNEKKDDAISKLLLQKVIAEKVISLPLPDDHNRHACFIKVDALAIGSYYLLLSDSTLKPANNISVISFEVTSIAIVNNDKRLYVLDRKTGFPLAGAKVEGSYIKTVRKDSSTVSKTIVSHYSVNDEGYVNIKDDQTNLLKIVYGKDTLISFFDSHSDENKPGEDIYDKDEYDDLVEYYEENAKVHIFTDRSIYRPGQTAYYKVLLTTKNPQTGETIVMNKQNLRGNLFNNFLNKWIKQEEPLLYLKDAFGKEIDSVKIKPNEFGSQAGSFIIPKTAATGKWNIEPDYIEAAEENEGEFSVEEYKRPMFDVSIETSKELLKPGDPFSIKVRVRSFAGASLNNVRINYTLERAGYLPLFDSISQKPAKLYHKEYLSDTTGYTDSDGKLEIIVKDSLLKKFLLDGESKWDFDYRLEAEAIDETGESYEADANLGVSSRPVRINIPLEKMYERLTLHSIKVAALDKNSKEIPRNVIVRVFRIPTKQKMYSGKRFQETDRWIYRVDELEKDFPFFEFEVSSVEKIMVLEKEISTGEQASITLPLDGLVAGNYEIEAICKEDGKITGETSKKFSVFDAQNGQLPDSSVAFYQLPINLVRPGDTIVFYSGNAASNFYSIYQLIYYSGKNKSRTIRYFYDNRRQHKGINKWMLSVPADVTDEMKLVQVYVLNNNVYTHEERIFVNNSKPDNPEIILEQYRKTLLPGAKETFSVSVKTKSENTAAELLTTMYDASLDKLEEHHWSIPREDHYQWLNQQWQRSINNEVSNQYGNSYDNETYLQSSSFNKPLWWTLDFRNGGMTGELNTRLAPAFYTDMGDVNWYGSPGMGYLMGRAPGVSIADTKGLNEVVVTGYGTQLRRDMTGSVSAIRIRGVNSLSEYNQPLIILDGMPFAGDLGSIDPKTITDIMILRGADASAIYGARAGGGVLILSTKGEIKLPAEPEPVIPVRKNFSETAFFFPQVHADKDGYYRFEFEMPESVTEWNWKIFAHTKKAQFSYVERKLNTQLPLMVQPNMPRFLYQGDKIILQSRISNFDSLDASGKAFCKIEDAITGEEITSSLVLNAENNFSVNKKGNTYSSFEIKIPKAQLNPLKITITARCNGFADGEEHVIPILNPQILVRENVPFAFLRRDTTIQSKSFSADEKLYGVGISILPKPQAALINALPYLANYSYDCSEQTFNKILAYTTAYYVMRNDKQAQQSFEHAKQIVEKQPEHKQQLPDELSEQAMPWLNLSSKTGQQQRHLFEVLDTSRAKEKIRYHLEKLYKHQNGDGGLAWFEGGNSDDYISFYVLAGVGRLKSNQLIIPENVFDKGYETFIEKLNAFCNDRFSKSQLLPNRIFFDEALFYAYAKSFWENQYPVTDSSRRKIKNLIENRWKKADHLSLYYQVLLITTTLHYFENGSNEYQKAIQQLNSIEQLAIKDDMNGIRWKDLADADDMSNTSEETLSLIADAFRESGIHKEIFPGITKWLLTTRNDDSWNSTKGTSAAIEMLFKENRTVVGATQTISLKSNEKVISVTDDLLSGNMFNFIKNDKQFPIELNKQSEEPAFGNMFWYYFAPYDKLNVTNQQVKLRKELFRYNKATAQWERVTGETSLKIADKIKVELTIEASKALRYVYIDDKRAAAFEPEHVHSGYQYAQAFPYYTSVRDTGMELFAEFIPSGKSSISYEIVLAHEGNFVNGPAFLQCMYRPDVNAYSNTINIQAVK